YASDASFNSSIVTELDLPDDASGVEVAKAPPATEEADEENASFEDDPWNAVCVVGLRVYSKDKGLSVEVVRPKHEEDEADTPLDLDDASKGANRLMAAIAQTIAVVDKSGKVVSTSKHLVNVFKEAKAAYREKKAEIVAGRQYELDRRRAIDRLKIDDDRSSRSSRKSSRSKPASRRPTTERYRSDSAVPSEASMRQPPSPSGVQENQSSPPPSPRELIRRQTAQDSNSGLPRSPPLTRSKTSPCEIDMDLAYGDIPPPLEVTKWDQETELKELQGLVGKVKMALDEADCLQHSATAIISSLQKNPDAMAAVALTLAEISNIVSKLAPGALVAIKGSAPAVFALLASPQFLIAAGVGVGVTIVALGGFKIIKKIKAKHTKEDPGMDELLEIEGVSRIENWRRGITEAEVQSVGTSVDGEFITPQAAALSRLNLNEEVGSSTHQESIRRKSTHTSKSNKSKREGGSKERKTNKNKKEEGERQRERKEKRPSRLRLILPFRLVGPEMTDVGGPSMEPALSHMPKTRHFNEARNRKQVARRLNERESHQTNFVVDLCSQSIETKPVSQHENSAVPSNGIENGCSKVWSADDDASEPDGKYSSENSMVKDPESALSPQDKSQRLTSVDLNHTSPKVNGAKLPMETHEEASALAKEPQEKFLKLSPAKIYELTSSPNSLPVSPTLVELGEDSECTQDDTDASQVHESRNQNMNGVKSVKALDSTIEETVRLEELGNANARIARLVAKEHESRPRRLSNSRRLSTPLKGPRGFIHDDQPKQSTKSSSTKKTKTVPAPLELDEINPRTQPTGRAEALPSPMPQSIPIPPLSLSTHLQLELSSQRPPPVYLYRSATSDFPYESSRVKLDRLKNFLLLPFQLESVLWFGTFACLDAWLFCFTILPLRFLKAVGLLIRSWGRNAAAELRFIALSLYEGPGRMWRRRRSSSTSSTGSRPSFSSIHPPSTPKTTNPCDQSSAQSHFSFPRDQQNLTGEQPQTERNRKRRKKLHSHHQRSKSTPSELGPDHKADIIKGFLILFSCLILMRFDASRMYHGIRGQAAIKLYAIYNVLECSDKLFSALGQDVLECLISKEALERRPDGRSKVLRPLGLFVLALVYNVVHSMALFYQVITLNVAVNSYSNALFTLLLSNQFVEIKSTVFKKFEKENLFQLTCADIVERFHLWLMLTIIALRNVIETGGFSGLNGSGSGHDGSSSILPSSFTLLPSWTGINQVMGPYIIVLGSEMLVDWFKHCYITKFNNTKREIYGRFFDCLAKDYYSNAFADQNLTRRLGLAVVPLSCLFIRASVQTYHMFLATHMPLPIASTATSLSVESAKTSPATTAALQHIDLLLRNALGRSAFGAASSTSSSLFVQPRDWIRSWTTDDLIALATMLVFFLLIFLVLLTFKLVLGMVLLNCARSRYRGMKERESA
ncbi:MAG: hypothetical protein Q9214_002907, partial [Letrouitia sp. 1 TL-2023]